MLYVAAVKLAEAAGVSYQLVNRWVQSGWLRGVDGAGRHGLAIPVGARDVLIELDALPRLIADRQLPVDLDHLKGFAIERLAEPAAAPALGDQS